MPNDRAILKQIDTLYAQLRELQAQQGEVTAQIGRLLRPESAELELELLAPAAVPQSDTRAFLDWFQLEYAKRRHGAPYCVRWPKHSGIVKPLLQVHPLGRLKTLAAILLSTDEEWVEKTDRGIEVLGSKINWLADRLAAWEAQHAQARGAGRRPAGGRGQAGATDVPEAPA